MIRTAILTGILLIMLSIAFSRMEVTPDSQRAAALVDQQPAIKPMTPPSIASAEPAKPIAAPRHIVREAVASAPRVVRHAAPAADPDQVAADLPLAPAIPAETVAAAPAPVAPAPITPVPAVLASAPAAPIAVAPAVAQAAPVPVMPVLGAPAVAQAPAAPVIASAPSPLVPPPAVERAPVVETAQAAPPKAADLPTINVASRQAMTPWDAPAGTTHVDAANGAANAADPNAPKFMTPQERAKELYNLARDMEDTFIAKLAR